MARQGWGRHTVVATGTNDASKQVSVSAWNNDLDNDGVLGFTSETIVSASTVTPTNSLVKLSGSTSIDTIAITNTNEGDLLWVYTSGSVTLNNTSSPSSDGDIKLLANANKDLSTTTPTVLIRISTYWYEYLTGEQNAVTASSTTTFTNKSIDLTDNTLTGTSLELKTAISDETGSGSLVFATSPTFVTPVLGTPASGALTNCTALPAAQVVQGTMASGMVLVAPALGTPASGTLTNCTFPTLNQSTTGSAATLTTTRAIGGVNFDGSAAITPANITVADTTDTSCSVALFESATGDLPPKSDGGLTYNAGTGTLTATAFAGPITGNVTGNASGTALTVTQAAQTAITSVGTLTSLASGAITTTGTLTMSDNIITGIHSLDTDVDTISYAATVDVDFDDNEEMILGDLTGNIAFTGSNYALGKHRTFHMESDGTSRTFTFPAGWVFYGDKPTETTVSKKSCLSLSCIGSAEADVRAVFIEEG